MRWFTADMTSKGQKAKKATCLAELAARREEAQGQFWTPAWVASGIWAMLSPVVNKAARTVSVVDTSVGIGRLLAPAPVESCVFYGLDTDEGAITELIDAVAGTPEEGAYHFEVGAIEDLKMKHFDIAVVNPPYGLTLSSPNMQPLDCTRRGAHGPNTSALSQEYALAQALKGAQVVAAVLPLSMDAFCRSFDRLAARVVLPRDTFRAEGANVATAVYVFGRYKARHVVDVTLASQADTVNVWPVVPGLDLCEAYNRPVFAVRGIDEAEPTITTPVTGDPRVTLHHHGRELVLKFGCGLTEAKVLNALLKEDLPTDHRNHRYPRKLRYTGSARLLLDSYLVQDDPDLAFDGLLMSIRDAGGEPVVTPTLGGYWKRLKRAHTRARIPNRHTVKARHSDTVELTATRSSLLRPGDPSAPAIRRGEILIARNLGGEYEVTKDGVTVTLSSKDVAGRFEFGRTGASASDGNGWHVVHEGLPAAMPALAHDIRARFAAAGVTWLWPYQLESAVELLMRPYGNIMAHEQGCGKARVSLALCLVSSGHSLLCVEPGLIAEMKREIAKVGLKDSQWKHLESHEDAAELRSINLVSYSALKRRDKRGRTLAAYLRRRINLLVADEGSILRNPFSHQSRAVMQVSARRIIIADGTPMRSYARDIHPQIAATSGSGVSHQPFGIGNDLHLEPRLINGAHYACRGVDAFRDKHMSVEWATHDFREDNQEGAKREVPKLRNVVDFRDWVAPLIQRRLRDEPEVRDYAGCPPIIEETRVVDWDRGHLALYLKTAVEFARWYREHKAERETLGKGANLALILARIQSVVGAANSPHAPGKNAVGLYAPLTSKQRAVIERIEEHVAAGRKTLVYCYSPATVKRLHKTLTEKGIKAVPFHGDMPIDERVKLLDSEFRFGDASVLICTWVGQRGVNLEQASAVCLYERSWSGDVESQAIARTQRPSQEQNVLVDRFHIRGSIDEYMGQMVDWKLRSAAAGLDYGDGVDEDEEFLHLDHILESFCDEVLSMSAYQASEELNNDAPNVAEQQAFSFEPLPEHKAA